MVNAFLQRYQLPLLISFIFLDRVWKYAWDFQNAALPVLHRFDRCHQKDSFVNLPVLWWKAIAGNRLGSLTFDGFTAFDLLPSLTRWIVGFPFCWLYPRLHHQNVALRTAYLDRALISELEDIALNATSDSNVKPRVITLGAGFDTRSLRFLEPTLHANSKQNLSEAGDKCRKTAEFYEIDLPSVVEQKRLVFGRYLKRRPDSRLPDLLEGDLNDIEGVRSQLKAIYRRSKPEAPKQPTIFLVEGTETSIYTSAIYIYPALNYDKIVLLLSLKLCYSI
jgi:hypothetical protein